MLYLIVGLITMSIVTLVYSVATLSPARSRAIGRRLAELETSAGRHYTVQRRRRQKKRQRVESLLESLGERMSSQDEIEWSEIQKTLLQAGFRRSGSVAVFYATRVLAAASLATLGFFGGILSGVGPTTLMMGVGGLGLIGWIIPRFYVSKRVKKRQKEMQKALADTLDLMVVCVEAGLGLNQALVRVSEEIEHVSSTMAEELVLTNLEIRAGTPRDEALRNLGERTGVGDLKALTAMLIQTDRFGTSIGTALRVHSDTMRTKRRQRAEEAAAKTTIKLVFPLVLFIFPAMFVVILGPAVLHILDQMEALL